LLSQDRAIKQQEKEQKKKKWEQNQKRKQKRSKTISTTSTSHTKSTDAKDEEELLREFALLKKLKKKKISESDFESLVGEKANEPSTADTKQDVVTPSKKRKIDNTSLDKETRKKFKTNKA